VRGLALERSECRHRSMQSEPNEDDEERDYDNGKWLSAGHMLSEWAQLQTQLHVNYVYRLCFATHN